MNGAIVQPPTTPEFEEAIVLAAGKETAVPLSKALFQLIEGICDQTFTKEFFKKIAEAEAKKFTGEYLDYWENGKLKIKAYFKEGKVDGHVHGWYDTGQEAFKAFFYENVKAGIHMAFYPPETPRCPLHYRHARLLRYNFDGQLDEKQKSNDYSGDLKSCMEFKHGILDGLWILYNANGKCIKDEFYKNGKIIPGKTTKRKK